MPRNTEKMEWMEFTVLAVSHKPRNLTLVTSEKPALFHKPPAYLPCSSSLFFFSISKRRKILRRPPDKEPSLFYSFCLLLPKLNTFMWFGVCWLPLSRYNELIRKNVCLSSWYKVTQLLIPHLVGSNEILSFLTKQTYFLFVWRWKKEIYSLGRRWFLEVLGVVEGLASLSSLEFGVYLKITTYKRLWLFNFISILFSRSSSKMLIRIQSLKYYSYSHTTNKLLYS